MKTIIPFCLTLIILIGSAGVSKSADFKKGENALKKRDFATAVKEWGPLVDRGHDRAERGYGDIARLAKDYKGALKFYTRSAKKGNARAQYQLGSLYSKGKGVPKDIKTAIKWWTLAAEQPLKSIERVEMTYQPLIQYLVATYYLGGEGIPQDYKTALKYFRMAAKQGNADSQVSLGNMYAKGRGVPQDYKTALKWYKLAAEQGNAIAQISLGLMYGNGQGVIQDNVYAHMWFNIAASSGKETASKSRDIVAKRMTPADISAAQKLARECVRKNYKGC